MDNMMSACLLALALLAFGSIRGDAAGCADIRTNCPVYAVRGYCSQYYGSWMKTNCPISCNQCPECKIASSDEVPCSGGYDAASCKRLGCCYRHRRGPFSCYKRREERVDKGASEPYLISDNGFWTFQDAQSFCKANNGALVEYTTAEEYAAAVNWQSTQTLSRGYWTGMTIEPNTKSVLTSDGQAGYVKMLPNEKVEVMSVRRHIMHTRGADGGNWIFRPPDHYLAFCKIADVIEECSDADVEYVVTTTKMNWSASRTYCRGIGGDLAVTDVKTMDKRRALVNHLSIGGGKYYYIGLHEEPEGVWHWNDDPSGTATDQEIVWLPGEPDNNGSGDNCGMITSDNQWQMTDRPCERENFAICERRKTCNTDECTDNCGVNAACTNTDGSFTCVCNAGYSTGYDGDGVACMDIDECILGTDNCDHGCTNTDGSFTCTCNAGFVHYGYDADGYFVCMDINECAEGTDNCDVNAACTNTDGSFTCTCNTGYTGDGVSCNAIKCWSERLNGKYIEEGHFSGSECYQFEEAIQKCEAAPDCHGIATQKNFCGGLYRVSHGATATLLHWWDWQRWNKWAYTLDRACLNRNHDDVAAVNGGYTEWTSWGSCSLTCGDGTQTRSRTCTNPAPKYGGSNCDGLGEDQETQNCRIDGCRVHGRYSAWSEWGECSVTCGGVSETGTQTRTRTCTNPAPAYGGNDCRLRGPSQESRSCSGDVCDDDVVNSYTYSLTPNYWQMNTWQEAREYCQSIGGDLAVQGMKNLQQRRAILKKFAPGVRKVWIGFTDIEEEKVWKWVDGSGGAAFWRPKEPNGHGNEDCGMIEGGDWRANDVYCGKRMRGLCEVSTETEASYFFSEEKYVKFEDAKAYCESKGATPIEYTTEEEYEDVVQWKLTLNYEDLPRAPSSYFTGMVYYHKQAYTSDEKKAYTKWATYVDSDWYVHKYRLRHVMHESEPRGGNYYGSEKSTLAYKVLCKTYKKAAGRSNIPGCDGGFVWDGRACITISDPDDDMTYADAESHCQSNSGNIVRPDSPEMLLAVREYFRKKWLDHFGVEDILRGAKGVAANSGQKWGPTFWLGATWDRKTEKITMNDGSDGEWMKKELWDRLYGSRSVGPGKSTYGTHLTLSIRRTGGTGYTDYAAIGATDPTDTDLVACQRDIQDIAGFFQPTWISSVEQGECAYNGDTWHGHKKEEVGREISEAECLALCAKIEGVTGCQYNTRTNEICTAYTDSSINSGNGYQYYKCWVFRN